MAPVKQMLQRWNNSQEETDATGSNENSGRPEVFDQSFYGDNAASTTEQEVEEDWSDVSKYFTPEQWNEIPLIERLKFRIMKERYEYMSENSNPISKPYFMCDGNGNEVRPSQRKSQIDKPVEHGEIRTSSRSVPKRNYREVSPPRTPTRRPVAQSSTSPHSPASSVSNTIETNRALQTSSVPSTSSGRRCGGRISDRTPRTFDQMVHGLPIFGEKSLQELSKKRIHMNIAPIYQDCKDHIRRQTGGNEYLTRKEWTKYATEVCDAYPNLKTEQAMYWESFKIGLQKSFSAERKNKKKKCTQAVTESSNEDEEDTGTETSTNSRNPLDAEAEAAAMELRSGNCDRIAIKSLIEQSLRHRKVERTTMTPQELLERYPYLKVPELMIYDYLNTIQVTVEECEKIFSANMVLIGDHFGTGTDSENNILNSIMKVHEFFISKAVKKGLKAVFIVKDEERQSLNEMNSSDIQAPFIVVLRRQDFVTGLYEVRSANLLMANNLVSSLHKPTVDKIMLMLLAAYVTLNAEYPPPYQQFMRALEKLVTGKAQPSKYGRTQVQYDRLMSLIKK
ncbi:Protein SSX2 [Frankliniella fusca]|uniref:Protein SSX2 n=2 Tax=Frankliniella fusca TaxID=407009 RepID=A0AAE1HBX9_9NEOP|nr:Protein SSX2 [Frankliniella fusca]